MGQAWNTWKDNWKNMDRLRAIVMKVALRYMDRVSILCQQRIKHVSSKENMLAASKGGTLLYASGEHLFG